MSTRRVGRGGSRWPIGWSRGLVRVFAAGPGEEPVLLEGSPRAVPAGAAMVIDGTIVNRVSDPQERRVPSALLVLREPAPAVPPAAAALAPEAEAAAQRADLDAAAADPGSTAGLLEWLAAQGAG
jgi:hypothetical protein